MYIHISKKKWHQDAKFEIWSNRDILIEFEEWNQYWIWLSEKEKNDRVIRICDVKFDKELRIYDWSMNSKLLNALEHSQKQINDLQIRNSEDSVTSTSKKCEQ
jgi:hypothetical protein